MPVESRRRLAPSLRPVDHLLDRWASWARRELDKLGYGQSMSAALIEWHKLGVAPDHYLHLRAMDDCPLGVLLADRLVARLEPPLHTAIVVHYFTYCPFEDKARAAHMSPGNFRRNLDRAMWSVRSSLDVLEVSFDVDANIKSA